MQASTSPLTHQAGAQQLAALVQQASLVCHGQLVGPDQSLLLVLRDACQGLHRLHEDVCAQPSAGLVVLSIEPALLA